MAGSAAAVLSGWRFRSDVYLAGELAHMCAFGGAGLDMLYVTSKSLGLTPKQRNQEPLAGKLLRFRPDIRGSQKASFGGAGRGSHRGLA